jgi:hypothetical protein
MTFDIPFDQPLDARSHGYINLTRENPQLKFSCEPHVFAISHSCKVDDCFITSNILHSAIIIWSSSNVTKDTKWWTFRSLPCWCCVPKEVSGFRNTWWEHYCFISLSLALTIDVSPISKLGIVIILPLHSDPGRLHPIPSSCYCYTSTYTISILVFTDTIVIFVTPTESIASLHLSNQAIRF